MLGRSRHLIAVAALTGALAVGAPTAALAASALPERDRPLSHRPRRPGV